MLSSGEAQGRVSVLALDWPADGRTTLFGAKSDLPLGSEPER